MNGGEGEAVRGLLPPFLWGPRRENGCHGRRREGRYSEPKPPAGPERSLLARELYSPRIHPNRYDMLICILRSRQFTRINMLICFCARCRGEEVAAHLFRLDVKPCAVARRKAEIDTRASAPNAREEDGQWKYGRRAGTCRMRISRADVVRRAGRARWEI